MTRFIEFKDKDVVIKGAGGVLCGYLAKDYAKAGAKLALLDLN
ncbi:D-mannonate oxidoreductase, partial [Streptococcus suis]